MKSSIWMTYRISDVWYTQHLYEALELFCVSSEAPF
jgi:hypothetical protein